MPTGCVRQRPVPCRNRVRISAAYRQRFGQADVCACGAWLCRCEALVHLVIRTGAVAEVGSTASGSATQSPPPRSLGCGHRLCALGAYSAAGCPVHHGEWIRIRPAAVRSASGAATRRGEHRGARPDRPLTESVHPGARTDPERLEWFETRARSTVPCTHARGPQAGVAGDRFCHA